MEVTALIKVFASVEAAEAESAGIAALGIDPLAILAQAVTFLVLFWVVKKYALEDIVKTLESRRKTIDDGVRLGLKMEAEHAALQDKIEEQLRLTRSEADRIISDAHKESGEILKQAEADASHKVDTMLAESSARINEDMKRAHKELEKEIVGLIADATQIMIEEKVDATKDAKLISKALEGARK